MTAAFIWDNGTMVDLNTLVEADSDWVLKTASTITNDGQIFGSCTAPDGDWHGFLLVLLARIFHEYRCVVGGGAWVLRLPAVCGNPAWCGRKAPSPPPAISSCAPDHVGVRRSANRRKRS